MRFTALFLLALASCTSSPQTVQTHVVSTQIRSLAVVDGEKLKLSLTLEGSDGNALSGAYVGVTDPGGAYSPLVFDTRSAAYALSTAALEGEYKLEIQSSVAGSLNMSVPVVVLSPAPNVSLVRDGEGSIAQEFKKLKASTPILVEWQAVKNAQRYLLEWRQNGKTVFSKVVTESSDVLPAGTLTGTELGLPANVLITASSSSGDEKFRSKRFFSTASTVGSSLGVTLVP
jgi:hypothetical protein